MVLPSHTDVFGFIILQVLPNTAEDKYEESLLFYVTTNILERSTTFPFEQK
jgi:hypothetical protein